MCVQFQMGRMHAVRERLVKICSVTIMLSVAPSATVDDICPAAVEKHSCLDQEMPVDGKYILLFPDGQRVVNAPGSTEKFTLYGYKHFTGKPYQKLALFLCSVEDYNAGKHAGM